MTIKPTLCRGLILTFIIPFAAGAAAESLRLPLINSSALSGTSLLGGGLQSDPLLAMTGSQAGISSSGDHGLLADLGAALASTEIPLLQNLPLLSEVQTVTLPGMTSPDQGFVPPASEGDTASPSEPTRLPEGNTLRF